MQFSRVTKVVLLCSTVAMVTLYLSVLRPTNVYKHTFKAKHRIQLLPASAPNDTMSSELTTFHQTTMSYDQATYTQSDPRPLKVIVLAYMHTGSTYLASILQNHPDTFYEFEPLRSMQYQYNRNMYMTFLNRTIRRYATDEEFTHAAADTVWKLLTCQHEQLDIHTLTTHYFNLSHRVNRDDKSYFKCLQTYEFVKILAENHRSRSRVHLVKKQRLPETLQVSTDSIWDCLKILRSKCRNASMVVNKYIRMTMKMAEDILEDKNDANIKIINLYRDPRAMMDSQLRKNDVNVRHFPTFVNRTQFMCNSMLRDQGIAERLKNIYPDKIHTVRYETLIDRPEETVRRMFNFLGIPFLVGDLEFVRRSSVSNSSMPAWRRHISQEHLQVVDRHCHKLYDIFGYIPLHKIVQVKRPVYKDHFDFEPR